MVYTDTDLDGDKCKFPVSLNPTTRSFGSEEILRQLGESVGPEIWQVLELLGESCMVQTSMIEYRMGTAACDNSISMECLLWLAMDGLLLLFLDTCTWHRWD
jgi:hypothetical protein